MSNLSPNKQPHLIEGVFFEKVVKQFDSDPNCLVPSRFASIVGRTIVAMLRRPLGQLSSGGTSDLSRKPSQLNSWVLINLFAIRVRVELLGNFPLKKRPHLFEVALFSKVVKQFDSDPNWVSRVFGQVELIPAWIRWDEKKLLNNSTLTLIVQYSRRSGAISCRIVVAISSMDFVVDDSQRMPSRRIRSSASLTS